MAHNVWLVAGGQIKTFVLSHVIKISKELHTSMTHSPARLPQAVVGSRISVLRYIIVPNIVVNPFPNY
jgi:hypothetical protein